MIGELERLEIAETLPINRRRALSCALGLSQRIPGYRGDPLEYGGAIWRILRERGLGDTEIQAAGLAALSPATDPAPAPAPTADPETLPPGVRSGSEAQFETYPGAPADLDRRIAGAALDIARDLGRPVDVPRDLLADYRPDPLTSAAGAEARLQIEIYRRIGEAVRAGEE